MNIGELFISLGVKGAEKAADGISGVNEGLKKTSSTAWEVKAGLLGAMYALEHFTAAGNARGTSLLNMSTVLGVTTEDIERYTWAAQQAGVANEAVGHSFATLQSSMTKMKYEGNTNKWFALFSQFTGVTTADLDRLREHPEQMVQKLQDFYNKAPIDKSLKNEVIQQFGVGELLPAFARNEFRPDVLSQAPVHGRGEINALDENRRQWANLGTTFDMQVDKLNAKFGGKLVADIAKLIPEIFKMVDAFAKLADKMKLLEGVGKVFEGWRDIFHGLTDVVEAFSDPKKLAALKQGVSDFSIDLFNLGKTDVMPAIKEAGAGALESAKEAYPGATSAISGALGALSRAYDAIHGGGAAPPSGLPTTAGAAAPAVPVTLVNPGGSAQTEFNQTLNFHDTGKDALKIGEETRRAIQTAYRQNPALSRSV